MFALGTVGFFSSRKSFQFHLLYLLYAENNQSRPTAVAVPTTEGDDGESDFGEATYTAACEQLHINRVQRVIDGLSTTSLNLKYRCLGPLGAKALAAALSVSEGLRSYRRRGKQKRLLVSIITVQSRFAETRFAETPTRP